MHIFLRKGYLVFAELHINWSYESGCESLTSKLKPARNAFDILENNEKKKKKL